MAREQYEFCWKDYYRILQVDPTVDAAAIIAAYRKLARAYHPDRNDSPDATEKFQEINEAKEVLTDRSRRAVYDRVYWARQRGEDFEEPPEDSWDSYDSQGYQWEEAPGAQGSRSDYSWGNHQEGRGSYRSSRGSGYRWSGYRHHGGWDNRRSWSPGAWWEERPGEPPPDEPVAGETRQQARNSRFFLLVLISYLVDRISPDPDESQRILPWPSWAWQRTSLMAGMPLASLVFLMSVTQGAWVLVIISALWFAAALYSGISTGWMRRTRQAEPWARLAGGAGIILSGVGYALALAYALLIVTMLVAAFFLMGVLLRAMLDQTLDRR